MSIALSSKLNTTAPAYRDEAGVNKEGGPPETLSKAAADASLKQPRTKGQMTVADHSVAYRWRKEEEELELRDKMHGLAALNKLLRRQLARREADDPMPIELSASSNTTAPAPQNGASAHTLRSPEKVRAAHQHGTLPVLKAQTRARRQVQADLTRSAPAGAGHQVDRGGRATAAVCVLAAALHHRGDARE